MVMTLAADVGQVVAVQGGAACAGGQQLLRFLPAHILPRTSSTRGQLWRVLGGDVVVRRRS